MMLFTVLIVSWLVIEELLLDIADILIESVLFANCN